jgi:hypothetical protein
VANNEVQFTYYPTENMKANIKVQFPYYPTEIMIANIFNKSIPSKKTWRFYYGLWSCT